MTKICIFPMKHIIFPKFWEYKPESYLTLSVKIDEQGNKKALKAILDIQTKKIEAKLRETKISNDPYNIKNAGLLKYLENRIHFSLINFLTCQSDLEFFKNKTKHNKNYKKEKKNIIKLIENNLPHKASGCIKSIFSDPEGRGLDSFSLQIDFSYANRFIQELKEISDKFINHNLLAPPFIYCIQEGKIKGFPRECPKYFPINIFRFLSFGNKKPIETIIGNDINQIDKIVTNISQILKEHPIDISIKKIMLVESDPFLYKWNKIKDFKLRN